VHRLLDHLREGKGKGKGGEGRVEERRGEEENMSQYIM
jgi:hypothetical protein